MFAPVFEGAAGKHADATFAKLDTEAQQGIAAALEIQSFPTLMAFRGGVLVYREADAMNAAGFDQLVEAVKALDVEEVRQQAAPSQAAHEAGNHADHDQRRPSALSQRSDAARPHPLPRVAGWGRPAFQATGRAGMNLTPGELNSQLLREARHGSPVRARHLL